MRIHRDMLNGVKTMGDNLRIVKLRENISKAINEANLPIEVCRMVMNEFLQEITQIAQAQIEAERKENENDLCNNRDSDEQ